MNLAGLDMNLVVALRALLSERNVTRAGQRVGLSQPAMSAALARLRRHFGDELLIRGGSGYELTALGTVLLDRAAAACEMLERVFASQASFEAAGEEREFTVLTSDYAVAVYGTLLAREVSALAPGIRLVFRTVPATVTESPEALLSTVDGLLMPHGVISDLPAVDLFRDTRSPSTASSCCPPWSPAPPASPWCTPAWPATSVSARRRESACCPARSTRSPSRRPCGGTPCIPTTPATSGSATPPPASPLP